MISVCFLSPSSHFLFMFNSNAKKTNKRNFISFIRSYFCLGFAFLPCCLLPFALFSRFPLGFPFCSVYLLSIRRDFAHLAILSRVCCTSSVHSFVRSFVSSLSQKSHPENCQCDLCMYVIVEGTSVLKLHLVQNA